MYVLEITFDKSFKEISCFETSYKCKGYLDEKNRMNEKL